MQNEKVITTEKLTKAYGALTALDAVDLEIYRGEAFGLLGPNGAGKTTLISILSTLLRATSGRATLAGMDVAGRQAAVRAKIGIVFQDPSLDERLTAAENLELHCSLYGVPRRERGKKMDTVLDLIDLKARKNDLVRTFSGGMRRRLEIARCLLHTPEVLFLDEPTIGLDPQTREHIWAHIKRLGHEFGITTLVTTHYMDEADELCNRVAIIDHGKIVIVGTPEELKRKIGDIVLTLTTNRPAELLDALQLSEQERAGADVHSDRLVMNVANPEAVLGRAFKIGEERGIAVKTISINRPTLNDVFLKYTGHELRDEVKNDKGSNYIAKQYARRAGR